MRAFFVLISFISFNVRCWCRSCCCFTLVVSVQVLTAFSADLIDSKYCSWTAEVAIPALFTPLHSLFIVDFRSTAHTHRHESGKVIQSHLLQIYLIRFVFSCRLSVGCCVHTFSRRYLCERQRSLRSRTEPNWKKKEQKKKQKKKKKEYTNEREKV